MVLAAAVIAIVSVAWARQRIGSLSGGALTESPGSFRDLFKLYIESWHEVGMGSGESTPAWVLILGIASLITFGNTQLFLTLFFFFVPFIILVSAHRYLKKFTENGWLAAGASLLYALSPITIAAVNAGRLGVLVLLALLPYFIQQIYQWIEVEKWSWRGIYGHSLFVWVLAAFNPAVFAILIGAVLISVANDYQKSSNDYRDRLFLTRLYRRLTLLVIPFLLAAPGSFGLLRHPTRMFLEIGLSVPGGGPNLAVVANPGGPGSLPWWCVSPITAVLILSYFSTTAARRFATPGIVFLLLGTVASVIVVPGNGTTLDAQVFAGTFIALATLFSIASGVVMFDKIKVRLQQSNLNYRHFSVATVLILTLAYSTTAAFWLVTVGSNSPVQGSQSKILPAYLTVEKSAKTLVIRSYQQESERALGYYISRGSDVSLGEVDVAPEDTQVISQAVEGLIDNTGVNSSKVFSTFGIKYVFLKRPIIDEIVQTIDGLGGFTRTSATKAGIVWKVNNPTGRLIHTDYAGTVTILEGKGVTASVPSPGTVTLTENFSNGWRLYQDGYRSARINDENGLPTFEVTGAGEVTVFHDGTLRRAWISFFIITLVTTIVLALPAGRRKREISEKELA